MNTIFGIWQRTIRYLWIGTLAFLAFVVLYLLAATALSHIHTAAEPKVQSQVEIYLRSNGVHTDLVLPIRNDVYDWSHEIRFEHTRSRDTAMRYIGIGWGNKGFYLETPTWSELKLSVALNAIFGLGGSAMHTTFYPDMTGGESTRVLHLSNDQYHRLVQYILESFARDSAGHVQRIATDAVYSDYDTFYEGVGHYTMFHTCNSWTNEALKACGQQACVWTPFQAALMDVPQD